MKRLILYLLCAIGYHMAFQGCTKEFTAHPSVSFTVENDGCVAPCEVKFSTVLQHADNFLWDFGDGTKSTEANPKHTYTQPATYQVKLITKGDGGSTGINKQITIKPLVIESPSIQTSKTDSLGQVSVKVIVTILRTGSGSLTEYGVLYAENKNSLSSRQNAGVSFAAGPNSSAPALNSPISIKLSNLKSGSLYYYQAYALNSAALAAFGEIMSFTTITATSVPTVSIENEPLTITVPGGSFKMGSDFAEGRFELPIHDQAVKNIQLGKYEVTIKEYKAFCTATGRTFPGTPPGWTDNHPISNVNWADATAYCQWLSIQTGKKYRLPTEAEWEYAARGGEDLLYAGSNDPDEAGWLASNTSKSSAKQVGQKKANKFGLYDMSGNVWEWCSNWFGPYPFLQPSGPASGYSHTMRGGGFDSDKNELRVTNRGTTDDTRGNISIGFRVALDN